LITDYLLKMTLKGETNYSDKNIRLKVGYLASIVGIIINLILTITKLFIGFMISSVSVTADGMNNLSDTASSFITIIGFRLSSMPPDKEHPYGHGRVEYISALIIAFMVILVGFQFIQASYERIINPEVVRFEIFSFIILIISITFKIFLAGFNKKLGDKINSTGLKATATDALGDVLTTSVVVISIVIGRFTTLPIDGIIGVVVSILIMYNGYNLVKETISPLIGEAPDEELIKSIYTDVLSYEYIIGSHDLIIHTYGAGRTMATIDVEFPADVENIKIHEVIDRMERELGEKYNLNLVIHMDPLGPETKETYKIRQNIKDVLNEFPIIKSVHDFQLLNTDHESCIEFHVVVDGNEIDKTTSVEGIKENLEESVKERLIDMKCNIIIDVQY